MLATYNHAAYDALPVLEDAGKSFDSKKGRELIEQFRVLFQKHSTDRTFGLILNHRHFDLQPNERLVEYQGTSVPWTSLHEKTKPSTWLLSKDDQPLPYEFHYSADADSDDENESPDSAQFAEFIKGFNQILRNNDAVSLFGLCRYPGDDFQGRVEITEGRANINLHPDDAPSHLASREAAWYFSPNLLGKCTCICGGNGHTSATHRGHVATR